MMFEQLQHRAKDFVAENATTLLTAGGVVGTVATAVLAGRAGYKSAEILRNANEKKKDHAVADANPGRLADLHVEVPSDMLTKTEKLMLAGPQFIPPAITGGATIIAIIFSHKMSAQKAAALAAAYGLSQKQFEEYKAKVAEKLTGPKKQAVQDELAQDRIDRTPGHDKIVIIDGSDVLCFDQSTGRYFKSSMEAIQRAVNSTNAEILAHGSARASHFYNELELPETTWSNDVGWNLDNLLELDISTTRAPDGRPCLAIDFVRLPIEDYQRSLYR